MLTSLSRDGVAIKDGPICDVTRSPPTRPCGGVGDVGIPLIFLAALRRRRTSGCGEVRTIVVDREVGNPSGTAWSFDDALVPAASPKRPSTCHRDGDLAAHGPAGVSAVGNR